MTFVFHCCGQPLRFTGQLFFFLLAACLLSACSRFTPIPHPRDLLAERSLAQLKGKNKDLVQFKCVAKIVVAKPDQPATSFRAAMAGRLPDHVRIDLFAPFGGSAGTFSGNGKHLFLVTHPSGEYYKKRFGSGSLHRFVALDISVGDLLELMVGRIPVDDFFFVGSTQGQGGHPTDLRLMDRWGRVRQRIFFDSSMQPVCAQWLDNQEKTTHSATLQGVHQLDGFALPSRIDLSDASGHRLSIFLERYEANASMDDSLFVIAPPPS